jgi:hypothetical protein
MQLCVHLNIGNYIFCQIKIHYKARHMMLHSRWSIGVLYILICFNQFHMLLKIIWKIEFSEIVKGK